MYYFNSESIYTTYYYSFLQEPEGHEFLAQMNIYLTGLGFTDNDYDIFENIFNNMYWNYEIYCDYSTRTKEKFYKTFMSSCYAIARKYGKYYAALISKYNEDLDETEGTKTIVTDINLPNSRVQAEYPTLKTISTGQQNVITLRKQALAYIRNLSAEFAEKFRECFILLFN